MSQEAVCQRCGRAVGAGAFCGFCGGPAVLPEAAATTLKAPAAPGRPGMITSVPGVVRRDRPAAVAADARPMIAVPPPLAAQAGPRGLPPPPGLPPRGFAAPVVAPSSSAVSPVAAPVVAPMAPMVVTPPVVPVVASPVVAPPAAMPRVRNSSSWVLPIAPAGFIGQGA
jgi:hypothetical protein